jgi:AraC family transcriptional regulator of adaptative response / DNA-3-methyladenine glycosylase II
VRTTGVYCRPVCPAPRPRLDNVRFFGCAAAAEAEGFRPCRRCRPETAPGTPAWCGSSASVTRALRLIDQGVVEEHGIEGLAGRLGMGARHLRRLFSDHVGVSPLAVARTRRVHFARRLLDETDLPVSQVALASGFTSIRQFNDAIRERFGRPPRVLRRAARARGLRTDPDPPGRLVLRLPYRPPFDWDGLVAFLSPRALPGVEEVTQDAYRRTLALDGRVGWIEVRHLPGSRALALGVEAAAGTPLQRVVERVRRLFDLGADPLRIAGDLGSDPELARRLARRPGLRVPGAWDPFEVAVRAVLGQQVTVRGATTLAGRLVARHGTPLDPAPAAGLTHLFPAPEALVDAELEALGLPRRRADTLRALAHFTAEGALERLVGAELEAAVEALAALPGVGPWTAQMVAMRALGDPDAFPAGDLGLRRALGDARRPAPARLLLERAEAWRPWRAYAALCLWSTDTVNATGGASGSAPGPPGRARRSARARARGAGAGSGPRRAPSAG